MPDKLFKIIILIVAAMAVIFDALLYNFCEKQKNTIDALREQVEGQAISSKFKYQEEQIEGVSKAVEELKQRFNDQRDALADQKSTILQEFKDANKGLETSLVDTRAEADAIKQEMKGWQKDDASVLAALQEEISGLQVEIKNLSSSLTTFESSVKGNVKNENQP